MSSDWNTDLTNRMLGSAVVRSRLALLPALVQGKFFDLNTLAIGREGFTRTRDHR